MKKITVPLVAFVVVFLLMLLAVKIDLVLHPWVKEINRWCWWNYFTSAHCWTYLYLHHFKLWLGISTVWSGFLALVIWAKTDSF